MNWVVVRRLGGVWRVQRGGRPDGVIWPTSDTPSDVFSTTAYLEEYRSRIPNSSWYLELSKNQFQEDGNLLRQTEQLAKFCVDQRPDAVSWKVEDSRRGARALRIRMKDAGELVADTDRSLYFTLMLFWAAAAVACLLYVYTLFRFHPMLTSPPKCRGNVFAVHHGLSNRNRALLPPVRTPCPEDTFLILGRPRAIVTKVARELRLEQKGEQLAVFRAGSWAAGLAAMLQFPRVLMEGERAVRRSGVIPRGKSLVRIIYRCMLGECHAAWWRRSGLKPETVVYGHTGLADTTALELAQQAQGSITVHLVHGVSAGWNFTALSDLGVFKCGYDADWHAALSTYKKTASFQGAMPEAISTGRGWVLFSNYIHPMNDPDLMTRKELQVLELVASAARLASVRPSALVWKPHPTILEVEPSVREIVEERARELGFGEWKASEGLVHLRDYQATLTTPSTIALDALRHGKLPIIVSVDAKDSESVYSVLQWAEPKPQALATLIDALQDRATYARAFAKAWEMARPGAEIGGKLFKKAELGSAAIIFATPDPGVVNGGAREW